MYHVAGTAATVSILYIISYFFYRSGFYSLALHRRIWNTILAVTFIFTALAGLFLALQITYKWEVPGIRSILRWHVETGAGTAVTGLFHVIWHFSYFRQIFSPDKEPSVSEEFLRMNPGDISINLFILGFTSMSVQIMLMREVMNLSGGYELTTGIFLGSWLIASGIGAYAAGRSPMNNIRRINLVFAISPVISVGLMILITRMFLETGETPSLLTSLVMTFLVLIPFCSVSGYSFVKLLSAARQINGFIPGKSFSIETIGGITSGLILSVLTAGMLGTYQLLITIILLSLAFVLLTYYALKQRTRFIIKIITALSVAVVILSGPDLFFRHLLLPGVKLTGTMDTPYGNIAYGEYSGERSIYYNQRLLAYSDDAVEREENIHYCMLQTGNPDKVLLISGSLKSYLPEILKYPVSKVDYIERDPWLAQAARENSVPDGIALNIGNMDAFRYLKTTREKYDAVLLMVPPPVTLSMNRFYTTEFFSGVKDNLSDDGVFVCSPGVWDNYPNRESLKFFSSIYNSLNEVFKNVMPIAGNKLYLIASDKELSESICRLADEKKLHNIYVSSDYLSDDLIENKTAEITALIDPHVRNNTSLFPVASFHMQAYNVSRDLSEKIPSIIFLIIVFILPVITIRRRNMLMYCSASALAGFEIIIILVLQLIAGNMYQYTGLILAVLMTGLAAGAGINIRFMENVSLDKKAFILVIYYSAIALVTSFIIKLNSIPAMIVLLISTIIPSFFTGHIFRELTASDTNGSRSATAYSADLAGSAFGFMVISGVTVPLLGLKASIFLLSGLIFAGILLGTNRNKY